MESVSHLKKIMNNPFWSPLKKGDLVDIVAPASPMRSDDEKTIEDCVQFVTSLGLKARIPKDIEKKDLFFSNSDNYRFEHLSRSLQAPDSAAVWCLRGGYGSARLLPFLKDIPRPLRTKAFLGFSDITALHIFLNQQWGWNTLHSPGLYSITAKATHPESVKKLIRLLFGHDREVIYPVIPLNDIAEKEMMHHGKLLGGNLTLIQNSMGTAWAAKGEGKHIFFEEIDERGYRIDRILVQMKQAGLFEKAVSVVIGDCSGGNEQNGTNFVEEVLMRFAKDLPIPVVRCLGIGHLTVNNPLPLGTETTLRLGSKTPTLLSHAGFTCHIGPFPLPPFYCKMLSSNH